MILLQPDYLVFRTSDGDNIPCSAQQVTVELIGESAALLHAEVIQNAAQNVALTTCRPLLSVPP